MRQIASNLALQIFVVLLGLLGGCMDPPDRVVRERVADGMYGDVARGSVGTDAYPRSDLGAETRFSCGLSRPKATLDGTWMVVESNVSDATRIEFGFGVGAPGDLDYPVSLVVTAIQGERSETLFESVLGPGGESLSEWHDARLDLDGWRGDVRFEFSSSTGQQDVKLVTGEPQATVHFSCPVFTEPAPHPQRPNIILISLDTLRADRLTVYGYERPTSPNMQRIFGRDGLVVERAYTQATETLRGHTAMLFGLNPLVVRDASFSSWSLSHPAPTLADLLRAEGYRTAAFTEDAFVAGVFRFANGFERYAESRSSASFFDITGQVERTLDQGANWIEQHKDQQFFVFLHSYQVHGPYEPPAAYARRFVGTAEPGSAAHDSALYDAEIAYTDAVFGKFFERLGALHVLDDTILIVTSDHGEEFGEHGRRDHGATLHDEILRVPMMVRAPGMVPAGVRRGGQMSLVDLLPTVLELLDVPVPDWGSGRSFAEHWRLGSAVDAHRSWAEAWAKIASTYDGSDPTWIPPGFSVTEWPYRLLRLRTLSGARYELYDLQDDPKELRDLYATEASLPAAVRELRAGLDAYYESSLAERETLRRSFLPAKDDKAYAPGAAVDPAVTDKLRALGYLE